MKVVLVSNFNIETVPECLLASNLTDVEASAKAKEWNSKNCNDYSTYYAVAKSDDYRLHRGMADLV